MSPPYILEGRALVGASEEEAAPCIFCGTVIKHFNEGGVGWQIGALVNDKAEAFLICDQPWCDVRKKAETATDPTTPENQRVVWRCPCVPDYVENVGTLCHACRKPPIDTAWNPG
jgi:hypothetical protein